jgi:hypothetical protein
VMTIGEVLDVALEPVPSGGHVALS